MPDEVTQELGDFFDSIWHDTEAYVYIASMKEGKRDEFKQWMLQWPAKRDGIIRHVLAESAAGRDVYFSPSLYRERRPSKETALGSWVQWVDFDKNAPENWTEVAKAKGIPEPSLIVQSSATGNQHAYWRLNELQTTVEGIEDRNRSLAYRLGADTSGWDVEQLLRPPGTYNFGYKNEAGDRKDWFRGEPNPVQIVHQTEDVTTTSAFNALGTPEREYLERIQLKEFPTLESVLALGKWSEEFYNVFRMTKDEASNSSPEKRSGALMRLGYLAVEHGLTDEQTYVVLDDADKRWDKYTQRSKAGRYKLLLDIIARARAKHGYVTDESLTFAGLLAHSGTPLEKSQVVFNFTEFLDYEVEIEWVIEGLLTQGGFVTITGAPGVGKTQFAIQLLINLALGNDKFLKWPVSAHGQKKVMFLSLEMPHAPLKLFISQMARQYPDRLSLAKNMHIAPLGEPVPLETKQGQAFLDNVLSTYKPDILLVDSLQAISGKSVSDEEVAKNLVNYLASVRKRTGVSVVLIHHNRKKPADGKTAGDLSDLFGSQFLAAAMDAVLNLRAYGGSQVLSVDCWKNRLAMMWPTFEIQRNKNLQYDLYTGGLSINVDRDNGEGSDALAL